MINLKLKIKSVKTANPCPVYCVVSLDPVLPFSLPHTTQFSSFTLPHIMITGRGFLSMINLKLKIKSVKTADPCPVYCVVSLDPVLPSSLPHTTHFSSFYAALNDDHWQRVRVYN